MESWLRSLVYLELRAQRGLNWLDALAAQASQRAKQDIDRAYLAGPDSASDYEVSYLDVFDLFEVIDRHWNLFEPSLPMKAAWAGRVAELRHIRNGIAHCRRPQADDLSRLTQALRDLEVGAREACRAFNDRQWPDSKSRDPLVRDWGSEAVEFNNHLIQHAQTQYETRFMLRWSRRPWAEQGTATRISGRAGYIWHASFTVRGNTFDPVQISHDYYLDAAINRLLIFIAFPSASRVDFSFAAVDDPAEISEAIATCFEVVLANSAVSERYEHWWHETVSASSLLLPPKVHIRTPWTLLGESPYAGPVFNAQE